ncbi:hypothetical protein [Maricaulis sp.]|uniref:hypothetical protein n=1 Tax=Maricaulis sp. TaxID=1486257 RepID=UPI00262067C2|nr:hypothetical protein [Maricaulis sp.]
MGLHICGLLDLTGLSIPVALTFSSCKFDGKLVLYNAKLRSLALDHCLLEQHLFAGQCEFDGSVSLRKGLICNGECRFADAVITGSLYIEDHVSFLNIAGNSALDDFPVGHAMTLRGATVGGSIFIRKAVRIRGSSNFKGLSCGGDCELLDVEFCNPGDTALFMTNARIEGDLILTKRHGSVTGVRLDNQMLHARFVGTLDLRGASCRRLVDSPEAWPGRGELILDGFDYGGFHNHAPVDFASRKAWLELQPTAHLNAALKRQPFEQLVSAMRKAGHGVDAQRVEIEKNRLIRKASWCEHWSALFSRRADCNGAEARGEGAAETAPDDRPFMRKALGLIQAASMWCLRILFDFVAGYGYRPARAVLIAVALIGFGAVFFDQSYKVGGFVPNNPFILRSEEWAECSRIDPVHVAECWRRTPQGEDFPDFVPLAYAVDTFFPVVNLHQEPNWIPRVDGPVFFVGGHVYMWIHIAFGYILTALAVAGLTGAVKRE